MPQFIKIDQFINSRGLELKHFTNILNNKSKHKLEHQGLPRHLRRRAMAHNYYRIPLRIRMKSLKDMAPSEPDVCVRSRCRRHRRKLRFLLNAFERRE